ncbi:MAG: hypothetical protein A2X49_04890 [Lentisphaerae bacterium GWF2_52_8]|nr:MAG: hypothetical protein A2X49_04890 [Lentisphaerae bacterium GWF2_52_8]
MRVALICVGDELLKGATVNTNMAFIGQSLLGIGIIPQLALVVPDSRVPLKNALSSALKDSDLVLTSGGLGPTADDITRDVVAEFLGLPLKRDEPIAQSLREFWKKLRREAMPESILSQANVPEGAQVIPNRTGTAPGLRCFASEKMASGRPKEIILLPGPPQELNPMFTNEVLPILRGLMETYLYTEMFTAAGMPETIVEEKMKPVTSGVEGLSVAWCASFEGVRIFLAGTDAQLVARKASEVKALFPQSVLRPGARSLADEVSILLREKNCRLATAESCTGGMIAAAITDLAGSSDIFLGSVVAYDNSIKRDILGVPAELLETKGAVSPECALAMLEGVRSLFKAGAGIAVTGIAGPGGGSPEKPLGLVVIAVGFGDKSAVREYQFRGGRENIRGRASATALNLLRNLILAQI